MLTERGGPHDLVSPDRRSRIHHHRCAPGWHRHRPRGWSRCAGTRRHRPAHDRHEGRAVVGDRHHHAGGDADHFSLHAAGGPVPAGDRSGLAGQRRRRLPRRGPGTPGRPPPPPSPGRSAAERRRSRTRPPLPRADGTPPPRPRPPHRPCRVPAATAVGPRSESPPALGETAPTGRPRVQGLSAG